MSVNDVGPNGSPHTRVVGRTDSRDGETGGETEVTPSVIYSTISNDRRRYVLRFLQTEDREVHLREMAERVAAWENDEAVEAVTTKERRRVETALRQFHIPKMDDAGFVAYDERRKTVRLAVPASTFVDYLDPQTTESHRWNAIATALGAGSLLAFAASYLFGGAIGAVLAGMALFLVGAVLLGLGAFYSKPSTDESPE